MKHTEINIDENNRSELAIILNSTLTKLIDLSLSTKHAHWNLRGSNFYALHKLFDDLYEKLPPLIDDVAERISTLGYIAEGRLKNLSAQDKLSELTDVTGDLTVLASLTSLYVEFTSANRPNINKASDLGDEATADLLTEVQRETDLALWFLEGHKN